MDLGISGRAALVMGASRGIGRAIAEELVAEGAAVAISSRDPAATAAELGVPGVPHDSADLDAVPSLVAAVESSLGRSIDILVANTGGPPGGPDPLGFSRDEWESAYRELVLAPLALVSAVMPGMRSRGWGRIVNVVSTSVREPIETLMLSNTHRAGTLAAWKTLARHVAGDGVTVNSVLPGRIATERITRLYGGSMEEAQRVAAGEVPAGRLGEPAEMAAAAAFLCSDRAAYITGVALLVDGGLTRSI